MIPIAKSQFDLTTLFKTIKEYTGEDCKVSGEGNANTIIKSLKNQAILKHISYSFMTAIPDDIIMEIIEKLNLTILIVDNEVSPKLMLLTGSLEQWKNSIITGCNIKGKPALNKILAAAFTHFKNTENLGYLFDGYSCVNQGNQMRFLE